MIALCTVDGCDRTEKLRKGFCDKHYLRWRRHGDPLAGRTSPGNVQRYFREVVMAYEGDECLIWPYARQQSGYPEIRRNGTMVNVHRLVCVETYGPPPTPDHETAHSCGKGHDGCVSKRHLRWATSTENRADTLIHGTRNRGERHGLAKLTEDRVRLIRRDAHIPSLTFARQFGVSDAAIRLARERKSWAWLD